MISKTLQEAWNFEYKIHATVTNDHYGFFRTLDHYLGQLTPWYDFISSETAWASAQDIDYMYYARSGEKLISPLLAKALEAWDEDYLAFQQKEDICAIVCAEFLSNWQKRWDALIAEYAPLENYSMTEQMEDDITEHEKGSALTTTKTGTETATPDTEITEEGSIYGYDSSQPSPSDKSVTTNSGTNEVEYDTTETATGSGTDTDTRNYTLTRRGNIGVTTSQQMLQSELEIRAYDYFKSVFEDVDKILTIPIY